LSQDVFALDDCRIILGADKDEIIVHHRIALDATVTARIERGLQVVDLETRRYRGAGNLAVNDIGTAVITLDRPLVADRYVDCRETGSFILIDPESCDTMPWES
jgi:sulfate adenylyltransferase subunit 1 (EFTu-like GTPase family)